MIRGHSNNMCHFALNSDFKAFGSKKSCLRARLAVKDTFFLINFTVQSLDFFKNGNFI